MRDETHLWLMQAEEDLKTARITLDADRHYAAAYFAQQAAEKGLKALLIERHGRLPRRTHDLRELAEKAGAPDDWLAGLGKLSRVYLISRYPDLTPGTIPARQIDEGTGLSYMQLAEQVLEWVQEQLKTQS